jgi:DNA-binding MarR family transcriptional regulator
MPKSSILDEDERTAILARFANNLPRNVVLVAASLNRRLVRACAESGFEGVRTSFVQLLFQLQRQPMRLIDVAQGCGLTQQVAGGIAAQMEQLGYLTHRIDAADRRAKRLRPTARGKALFACVEAACADIDAELAQIVEASTLVDFKTSCTRLFEVLVTPHADSAVRPDPVAALPLCLAGLGVFCERAALRVVDGSPAYGRLKMSYAPVLRYASPQGTPIADLARFNEVSKQAISQVVKQVEQLGYVQRRRHPDDARSVLVFLTDAGLRLIGDSLSSVERIEAAFARELGKRAEKQFADTVERLFKAFGCEGLVQPEAAGDDSQALLQQAMEQLYRNCGETTRARLFDHGSEKPKLSFRALRLLSSIELSTQ